MTTIRITKGNDIWIKAPLMIAMQTEGGAWSHEVLNPSTLTDLTLALENSYGKRHVISSWEVGSDDASIIFPVSSDLPEGVYALDLRATYNGERKHCHVGGLLDIVGDSRDCSFPVGSYQDAPLFATDGNLLFVSAVVAIGDVAGRRSLLLYMEQLRRDILSYIANVSEAFSGNVDALENLIGSLRPGISREDALNLIQTEGGRLFLSKKNDDTSAGVIGFLKGLWVKTQNLFGFSAEGDATVKSLTVKSSVGGSAAGTINTYGDSTLRSLILSITNAIAEKSSGFVDNEISGGLTGHGFGLKIGSDGRAKIQTDDLLVLGRMLVNTLEIREVSYIGGVYLLTPAGSKVAGFEALYSSDSGNTYDSRQWKTLRELHTSEVPSGYSVRGWRLYLLSDDGTTATMNYWKPGDMAYCQTFDIKPGVHTNVSNSYWRRLVTKTGSYTAEDNILGDGKGYDYIDVSDTAVVKIPAGTTTDWSYGMTVEDGVLWVKGSGGGTALAGYIGYNGGTNPNTTPRVDDKAVCLGSQVYSDRQAAVQISAEGVGSIDIFDGINGYDSLDSYTIHSFNKNKVRMSARRFEWRTSDGSAKPPTIYRGDWTTGAVSQWGDEWTYQGLQWLCVLSSGTTTEAPGTTAAYWMCLTPNVVRRWLQVTPTSLRLDSDGKTKTNFSLYIEGWKQTGNSAPVKLTHDDYDEDERIIVYGHIGDTQDYYLHDEVRLESGNDYFIWDTTYLRWKISRNNGVIPSGSWVNDVSVVWYTDSSETAYHDKVDIVTTRDGADGQDGEDGQDGQDGQDGADGQDGYSVVANPATVTLNEYYTNPGSFPTQSVVFSISGNSKITVSDVGVYSRYNVTATKTNNTTITIGIGSYTTGSHPTQGYVYVDVTLSNDLTKRVKILVAINWQGTIRTTIEGSVETTVAQEVDTRIENGDFVTTETLGTFVRSSIENSAALTRDVNGKLDASVFRQTVDGFTMELTSPLSVKGRNYLLQSASFTYKTRSIGISSQLYEDIRTLNPSAEHPVYLGLSCKYFATTASGEFNRSGFTTDRNRLGFYISWDNSIQLETFAYYSNPPSGSSKITTGIIETIKKVIEIKSIPGTLGDCSFYNQIYGGSYVADRVMIGFAKLEILEANDVNLITGWSIAPEDNYIDGNNLLDTATNIFDADNSSSYVDAWKNRKTTDVAISRGKTLRFTIPNFRDAVKNKSVLFYIDFKDTTGYDSYTFQLKAGGTPFEMSGVSALKAQSPYGYGYTRYFFRKFLDEHESEKNYTSGNTSINANNVDLYISSSSSGGSYNNPQPLYIKDAGIIALDEYNNITPSLQRTGIDIQRGKITAQTDNFEIVNSQGQQTFSIDQYGNLKGSGNAEFGGILRATALYRRMNFCQPPSSSGDMKYYETIGLYITNAVSFKSQFTGSALAEVQSVVNGDMLDWNKENYPNAFDEGLSGEDNYGYQSCVGMADIVTVLSGVANMYWSPYVRLPRPETAIGRVVEIYNRMGSTFFNGNSLKVSNVGGCVVCNGGYMYNGGFTPDNTQFAAIDLPVGYKLTVISVQRESLVGLAVWMKLELKQIL